MWRSIRRRSISSPTVTLFWTCGSERKERERERERREREREKREREEREEIKRVMV